jgi:hypothetical protein
MSTFWLGFLGSLPSLTPSVFLCCFIWFILYSRSAGQVGAPISRGMPSSRLRRGATLGMLITWFLLLSFWIP